MISVKTITSLKLLAQNDANASSKPDQQRAGRRERIADEPPMIAPTNPLRLTRNPES